MAKSIILDTAPRILLGLLFLVFGIDGFIDIFTGQPLLVPPVSEAGGQFVGALKESGFVWPLMKAIYLVAAFCLLTNKAPALAVALLAPIITVIVLFHVVLNPGGIPIAIILIVLSSLVFFKNRDKFKPLFSNS
ncbi:MAG: DoxX family protein [Pseudomonadota bacterium]